METTNDMFGRQVLLSLSGIQDPLDRGPMHKYNFSRWPAAFIASRPGGLQVPLLSLQAAGATTSRNKPDDEVCPRPYPCQEQTSAVGPCKALETALDFLRAGDVLAVTKLDRLARSVRNLCDIR
jgi:hypothetical protein